jgi:hypothetical protein
MSVTYSHYVKNNLDVEGTTFMLGSAAVGQSTAVDASAIFEAESTTKGLLIPRMTTIQRDAIATPAAGLMVYDTTENVFYHHNGTLWVMQVKNRVNRSNIIVGDEAGNAITTGAAYNVVVGRGSAAGLTTGSCNTIIGDASVRAGAPGDHNTCIGANVCFTSAGFTGTSNTALGDFSFRNLTSGNNNTSIGRLSANSLTTGLNNVILGSIADCDATLSNQIAIGYQATTTKANQCLIGNASLIECVPDSGATANLGTSTNPWNNIYLKGSIIGAASGSGVIVRTEVSTATYTLLTTDVLISSKYTATGAQTLTLPLVSSVDIGKIYHIVDTDGNAQTNNITIAADGSDTINGTTDLLMDLDYQSIGLFSDGSGKWFVY